MSGTLSQDAIGTTITATYASEAFTVPTTVEGQPEEGHLLLAWPG